MDYDHAQIGDLIPTSSSRDGTRAYTVADKLTAAALHLSGASIGGIARHLGVRRSVIQSWQAAPWWPEAVRNVCADYGPEIDAKLSAIIEHALENVLDRLEHGDYRLTRYGVIRRIPVLAKETAFIAGFLQNGLQSSRNVVPEKTNMHLIWRTDRASHLR